MTDPDDPTEDLQTGVDPRGDVDPAADAVNDHWEQVVADMSDLADEYRDAGWDAHELHPGDVSTFTEDDVERRGFELLAPDNEFDPIADAVEAGGGFGSATVYRTMTHGVLFLLVALEDEATETAVLLPAYYSPTGDQDVVEYLKETDAVDIHVRPLDERTILTFRQDDPSLFLPDSRE